MQPSPTVRRDRSAALLVALAVNGWVAWGLTQAMRPEPLSETDPLVLQVVWLPLAATARPTAASTPSAPLPAHPPQRPPQKPTRPITVGPDATAQAQPTAAPLPTRPMSAVYLAQIRQAADEDLDAPLATHDPLADRTARIPGTTANRFRMREPMSAARAVAMVGQLFGGNDPAEPCRSNRAEIAALGTRGDSRRLQQELDFERRWCRP